MKSKEIFQLAVRLLGLVMLYHAVEYFTSIFVMGGNAFSVSFIFPIALRLGLAYWLISGAPFLMRLAYPDPDQPAPAAKPVTAEG